MKCSIRKVTSLELVGEILDDVNMDQYILLNVEPVEHVNPVDEREESVIKVAVHNGLAFVIDANVAKQIIATRDGKDIVSGSGDDAA